MAVVMCKFVYVHGWDGLVVRSASSDQRQGRIASWLFVVNETEREKKVCGKIQLGRWWIVPEAMHHLEKYMYLVFSCTDERKFHQMPSPVRERGKEEMSVKNKKIKPWELKRGKRSIYVKGIVTRARASNTFFGPGIWQFEVSANTNLVKSQQTFLHRLFFELTRGSRTTLLLLLSNVLAHVSFACKF